MSQHLLFEKPPDLSKFPTRMEAETRKRRITERPLSSWQSAALVYVEEYARTHDEFLAEHVAAFSAGLLAQPDDKRAWGAVLKRAARKGIIEKIGYADAVTSNNSPKTLWRSRRYQERVR